MVVRQAETIESLFEGCKVADRTAQEKLYRMTASRMLAICMRYASSTFEAEDILQTAYIKVFTHIENYRGEGSFEGWIKRIMVNTAIESFRKNKRIQPTLDMESLPEGSSPEIRMDFLECEDLMGLIRQLPEGYRMVFNMYALEGYSHREIAETLGISEGTSKSQLLRARDWLKKRIKQMEGGQYDSRQA